MGTWDPQGAVVPGGEQNTLRVPGPSGAKYKSALDCFFVL